MRFRKPRRKYVDNRQIDEIIIERRLKNTFLHESGISAWDYVQSVPPQYRKYRIEAILQLDDQKVKLTAGNI